MVTQYAHVRGVEVAYADEGAGPLVLNLHGLTQSKDRAAMYGVLSASGLVRAGYRVVSYDARGHGDSSGAPVPESYRWEALADDLLELADVLSPGDPVRAAGLSMGTGTLLHALVRRPDRFAAVALGAPPTAWASRAAQVAVYERMAAAAEGMDEHEFGELLASAPVAPLFSRVAGFPPPPTPRPELLPSVLRGAGLSDLPVLDQLAAVDTPALILGWDADPGHPVSTAETLSSVLTRSTVRIARSTAEIDRWGEAAADFFRTAS